MYAETEPRTVCRPIIEIELAVCVLQTKDLTAGKRACGVGLTRDIRRDTEGKQVIELAGEVDVGPRDLKRRKLDVVFVDVRDLRRFLIGEIGEDGGAEVELARVIGRLREGTAGKDGKNNCNSATFHGLDPKSAALSFPRRGVNSE